MWPEQNEKAHLSKAFSRTSTKIMKSLYSGIRPMSVISSTLITIYSLHLIFTSYFTIKTSKRQAIFLIFFLIGVVLKLFVDQNGCSGDNRFFVFWFFNGTTGNQRWI